MWSCECHNDVTEKRNVSTAGVSRAKWPGVYILLTSDWRYMFTMMSSSLSNEKKIVHKALRTSKRSSCFPIPTVKEHFYSKNH
uniref:Uncharacterized protein n=1 Tax=Romanomermis culicivorax TaxID=13658 RepID=A0A915JX97_ROMCU